MYTGTGVGVGVGVIEVSLKSTTSKYATSVPFTLPVIILTYIISGPSVKLSALVVKSKYPVFEEIDIDPLSIFCVKSLAVAAAIPPSYKLQYNWVPFVTYLVFTRNLIVTLPSVAFNVLATVSYSGGKLYLLVTDPSSLSKNTA